MLSSHSSPRFRSLTSFALLGALILALMSVSLGRADSGRDFAGSFDYTGGSATGDPVTVTFTMRVFNHGSADVTSATLTVLNPVDRTAIYATFSNVSIAKNNSVKLSSSINVPRAEYDRWQAGNDPAVEIQYVDASGNTCVQRVQIVRMPGGVQ
jgi:hypothetical protein